MIAEDYNIPTHMKKVVVPNYPRQAQKVDYII